MGVRSFYSSGHLFVSVHLRPQFLNMVGSDIFVIFHHLVDDTVRCQFDDAVGNGLDKFVVMRREEDISFVRLQVVVERLDRFQVQMVGRSVQNEAVCIA